MPMLRTIATSAVMALILAAPLSFPLSAQKESAQVMRQLDQLKAKGAQVAPMSKMPKALAAKPKTARYKCDSVACWCSGDCFDMISNVNCKHLVCGNDHGTVVCWCDL